MTHYAIIGGGRLARHMSHYLSLLAIPCSVWARDGNCAINTRSESDSAQRLRQVTDPASHILLAVSDSGIKKVLKQYPWLHEKTLVHCAGAFSYPGIAGAHPLMTFGPDLYTIEQYQAIPFVVERAYEFARLLPGLPNPHYSISTEDKARYHALCVMAGNFSQLLWRAAADRFSDMSLPLSVLEPYLLQNVKNFVNDPGSALTGPLNRGDHQTVERNLAALDGDQLEQVYRSFVELHRMQQHIERPREAAV
jgi:predicted short-subunit dehydrogenase-like oxidoreductase (DUF2520 family)